MTEHTPGPWTARPKHSKCGGWWVEAEQDGAPWYVAECEARGIENEANARLIAAAPEIHEALRDVYDAYLRRAVITTGWAERAAAVLAKVDER